MVSEYGEPEPWQGDTSQAVGSCQSETFRCCHETDRVLAYFSEFGMCDLTILAIDDCYDLALDVEQAANKSDPCISCSKKGGSPGCDCTKKGNSSTISQENRTQYREMNCHKKVLAAHSDYFNAMLSSEMRESKESKIVLTDRNYSTIQAIVGYVYTGQLQIDDHNVWNILSDASFLQFNGVVDGCCLYLQQNISISNSVKTFFLAHAYNFMQLSQFCMDFILSNFLKIIDDCTDDLNALPSDLIARILASDKLNVQIEEQVYQCFKEWISFDLDERKEFTFELLRHIRVSYISPSFLSDVASKEPIIEADDKCSLLISEALHFSDPQSTSVPHNLPASPPRPSTLNNLFVLGGSGSIEPGMSSSSMEVYNALSDGWSSLGVDMPCLQAQFGVASVSKEDFYIIGGRNRLKTLKGLYMYNRNGGKMDASFPEMNNCRQGLSVCITKERYLFAIGGHDGWNYLNSVEKLDLHNTQHEWVNVQHMKATRSNFGCAVLNDKIYVVGGRDGSSCLSSVEVFDPIRNTWKFCASLQEKKAHLGVVALGGYLYALGGTKSQSSVRIDSVLDSVERYNPSDDEWLLINKMPAPRAYMGVCVLGNEIYVIGGHDGQSELRTVDKFNPVSETWTKVSEMSQARFSPKVLDLKK